jgi:amino acid transporter
MRVLYHMIGIAIFAFSLLTIPISINIAILRYRLWDIDLLIRRTLIYGVLTVLLILIYFASIVLMLAVLGPIVGKVVGDRLIGQASSLVPTLATLAIAALFNPLRRRVQDAIDRRFYRRKYDAHQVLARFAATVRDETDLQKLSEQLLEVVDESMQPASVSLWLKSTEDRRRKTE